MRVCQQGFLNALHRLPSSLRDKIKDERPEQMAHVSMRYGEVQRRGSAEGLTAGKVSRYEEGEERVEKRMRIGFAFGGGEIEIRLFDLQITKRALLVRMMRNQFKQFRFSFSV